VTLKEHKEFELVYRRGKNAHARSCVLFYLAKEGEKKVGFVASKKVGNAVIRNRSKRRMRALFRALEPTLGEGHYVMVAKPLLHEIPFETLQKDFAYILKKINVTPVSA